MNLLAIDTAANLCAACVWDTVTGVERGRSVADLGKGHAEHLMTTIADALAVAGVAYGDLGMIAVSVGPGSFTGVRVGVSTARGLALALKLPAAGVTTLDAIAAEARADEPGRAVLVAIEAGRGDLYAALYDPFGNLVYGPTVANLATALEIARQKSPVLAGSAARSIAEAAAAGFDVAAASPTGDIATYARIAAGRGMPVDKPKPLYLRAPDAKPQAGFVLPRAEP
jgi:tRNA threonylcarbamoyl adenosine modification protein YeaZ